MNFRPYQSSTTPSTPIASHQRARTTIDSAPRPTSNPFFSSGNVGPSTPSSSRNQAESSYFTRNTQIGSSSSTIQTQSPVPAQPTTRSRTLFYLSVRDSSGNSKRYRRRRGGYGDDSGTSNLLGVEGEERAGLMGREESAMGLEMNRDPLSSGLPPKWVDIMDDIEEIMNRVKLKIATLEKLHAKHVLPGFTDRSAEEREIESMTTDITRDFRRIHSLLKNIQPSSSNASRNELTTARNVQRGLASKVQDLSSVFRRKQRVYMETLQGHANKSKGLLTASGAISLKGPEQYDELQADIQASNTQLTQAQAQTHRPDLSAQIQKRDHELTQIAKSISELADLFSDLSNLVVEQGTVLDCVEYNVNLVEEEVKGAGIELKVAQRYQRKAGRRKCICFLLLLIVAAIIVLIYKPRGRSRETRPSVPTGSQVEDGVVIPGTSTFEEDVQLTTSLTRTRVFGIPSGVPKIRPPSNPGGPIRPARPRPKPHRPTITAGGDADGLE